MIYSNRYYVDKETGTYSDACAAFGLAHLLARALSDARQNPSVVIRDIGTCYCLELKTTLSEAIVAQATYPDELLPFIQNDPHSEGAKHYSIGEQIELLKSKSATVAAEVDAEVAAMFEVRDDFNVYSFITLVQGGKLWNRLADRLWQYRDPHYPELLKFALSSYCVSPNQHDVGREGAKTWFKSIKAEAVRDNISDFTDFPIEDTLLTVFTPTMQKSVRGAKPNGAVNQNTDGFWLPEWLKMIGMPHCTQVVKVRTGTEKDGRPKYDDRKVYVVSPTLVSLQSHTAIIQEFRRSVYSATSIRADILVLLNYTKILLKYTEREQSPSKYTKRGSGRRRQLRDVADGFFSGFYKNSSQTHKSAFSLTNLPYLQLPNWITFEGIPTENEILLYAEVIEHHSSLLFYRHPSKGGFAEFLDENQNEGHQLLRLYREFLSGSDIEPLLDFFSYFAAFIMHKASQNDPICQFNTSLNRRLLLIMQPTLQEILDDEGFRQVAGAINRSTVLAQVRKKDKKPWHHEVRYGLAQELKRKAAFKTEFTTALMTFINQFQVENARAREREREPDPAKRAKLYQVTKTHVEKMCALIDRCPGEGAEPVASLLLAFGYAYDDQRKIYPKDAEDEETPPVDETQEQPATHAEAAA